MRKIVLLLIITMSLTLTSGFSSLPDPQTSLNRVLESIKPTEVQAEITSRTESLENPGLQAQQGEQNYKSFGPKIKSVDELGTHNLRTIVFPERTIIIDALQLSSFDRAISTYLNIRREALAKGGEASLAIVCTLPPGSGSPRQVGEKVLAGLGSARVLQASEQENVYFSAAALIPGWGQPIKAGEDSFNVQILTRPNPQTGGLNVYLLAPVMQGDLGDL